MRYLWTRRCSDSSRNAQLRNWKRLAGHRARACHELFQLRRELSDGGDSSRDRAHQIAPQEFFHETAGSCCALRVTLSEIVPVVRAVSDAHSPEMTEGIVVRRFESGCRLHLFPLAKSRFFRYYLIALPLHFHDNAPARMAQSDLPLARISHTALPAARGTDAAALRYVTNR